MKVHFGWGTYRSHIVWLNEVHTICGNQAFKRMETEVSVQIEKVTCKTCKKNYQSKLEEEDAHGKTGNST